MTCVQSLLNNSISTSALETEIHVIIEYFFICTAQEIVALTNISTSPYSNLIQLHIIIKCLFINS